MREDELQAFVARRLPPELLAALPDVRLYPDELVVILTVDPPAEPGDDPAGAAQTLIAGLREQSRATRVQIARELEHSLGLPVAWGMRAGPAETLFSSRTAPVMTRLGRMEREVLDTLAAAGVADTRSSALAYVVRAFATEHAEWLAEVRQAIAEVDRVRSRLAIRPRRGAPSTSAEGETP